MLNYEISKHIECIDQVVKIFKLKIEELGSENLDKRIEEDVRKSLNKSIEDLKSKLNLIIYKSTWVSIPIIILISFGVTAQNFNLSVSKAITSLQ